ncbi:unnamed protein product, partial [Discosporangium mesarthrocarpum]
IAFGGATGRLVAVKAFHVHVKLPPQITAGDLILAPVTVTSVAVASDPRWQRGDPKGLRGQESSEMLGPRAALEVSTTGILTPLMGSGEGRDAQRLQQ